MSYVEKYKKIKNNLLKHGLEGNHIQNNLDSIIQELKNLIDLIDDSFNLLNTSIATSSNREEIMNQIKVKNLINIINDIKKFLKEILSDKYDNYTRITPIQIFLDSLNNSNELENYFNLIDQIK